MFGITGTGLAVIKGIQNGGKKPRYSLDQWDKQSTTLFRNIRSQNVKLIRPSAVVMDRDRRLTGNLRGQTDNPFAPRGFELNNPWRLEKRIS
ncbi:hypothetical protein ACHAQH_009219 [Verticillium albo-atrum]